MRKLLLKWVLLTVAVLATGLIVSALGLPFTLKFGSFGDIASLFVGAAVLALVNATLGRLLKFLTAPMNCMTLGLVSLIINALLFWWVGSLGFGFTVGNFLAALAGSVILSLTNGLLGGIFLREKDDKDED